MSASPDVPAQVMNTKPLFKLMSRESIDLFFTCNAPVKIKIDARYFRSQADIEPETVRQRPWTDDPGSDRALQQELEIDFAISRPASAASGSTSSISALSRHGRATSPRKCPTRDLGMPESSKT